MVRPCSARAGHTAQGHAGHRLASGFLRQPTVHHNTEAHVRGHASAAPPGRSETTALSGSCPIASTRAGQGIPRFPHPDPHRLVQGGPGRNWQPCFPHLCKGPLGLLGTRSGRGTEGQPGGGTRALSQGSLLPPCVDKLTPLACSRQQASPRIREVETLAQLWAALSTRHRGTRKKCERDL